MASALSILPLTGIGEIAVGDDLAVVLLDALARNGLVLAPGDILVVAQKIISKSEGRTRELADISPGADALRLADVTGKTPQLIQAVLDESAAVMRAKPNVLIVRHKLGLVMANAGIDQSNVPGCGGQERVLLLPLDPDASAAALCETLSQKAGVAPGIIISDSFGRAWRNGTVNVAIGAAGVVTLDDQRGMPDREGRALMVTTVATADALAAAAGVVMGEGAQGIPAVLIRGAGAAGQGCAGDLIRPVAEDMFP